jgi:hypothetical protein
MNPWQKMVREFHDKFVMDVADHPQSKDQVEWTRHSRRLAWIVSEVEEGWDAFHDENVARMADAYLDAIYFAIGGLVELGVDADPLFAAIHEANMKKVKFPGQSKIGKPTGWMPPDIAALIEEQRKPR